MNLLSDRIRTARRRRGLSQADVASELGVDRSAVGHWERGRGCTPARHRVLALAELLAVRVEWLMRGEEPMLAANASSTAEADALPPMPLSADEQQFLLACRRLPARMRQAMLDLLTQSAPPRAQVNASGAEPVAP